MIRKSSIISFAFFLFMFGAIYGQDSLQTAVAINGDGIFSILRKNGINPVKYYQDFITLNKANIKGANGLTIGKEYILPNALDAFKKMAVVINAEPYKETPLFSTELATMHLKDSTLKNVVYYLVYPSFGKKTTKNNDFARVLAKKLVLKGARVYLMDDINLKMQNDSLVDKPIVAKAKEQLGNYSVAINKKYLKHRGAYQQVLMIHDQGQAKGNVHVALEYYNDDQDTKNLASNLQSLFLKNTLRKASKKKGLSFFEDDLSVFFAKNSLPSVTTIKVNSKAVAGGNELYLKSDKIKFNNLLLKGLVLDYSSLDLE